MEKDDIRSRLDNCTVDSAIAYSKELARECARNCAIEHLKSISIYLLVACILFTLMHICNDTEGLREITIIITVFTVYAVLALLVNLSSLHRVWSDYNKCVEEYDRLLNISNIKTKLYNISKSSYSIYNINKVYAKIAYLEIKDDTDL